MTLQSMAVLFELKKLVNNTDAEISYLYNTTCFCLDDKDQQYDYSKYASEIDSIVADLVSDGYLRYTINQYNFRLTRRGIHAGQLFGFAFGAWFRDNWIAIIALIVAIIGLFMP